MIDINQVVKSHRRGETEVVALRGITCQIVPGEFTFILGPSGSGKSTLLYLLGALDEPTSGSITVFGRQLDKLSETARNEYRQNDVGFIFQNFNLIANLNAVENVLVPFLPHGVRPEVRAKAVQLLREVGLENRLDHRPAHLSGGEQQRVAIARALLKQPKLILADEPTGELDSASSESIMRLLRESSQKSGATVVIVTHEQQLVQTGDHVIRIRDGMVVN